MSSKRKKQTQKANAKSKRKKQAQKAGVRGKLLVTNKLASIAYSTYLLRLPSVEDLSVKRTALWPLEPSTYSYRQARDRAKRGCALCVARGKTSTTCKT